MTSTNKTERGQFATKLGVLATTVGSAVGLGNIWRFPYEAGTHGGGAFMLCYLIFSICIGIPLICAEFMLGRGTRSNIFGAYRHLAPTGKWWIAGYLGIIGAIIIPGFYAVVAGWTVEYFSQSAVGALDFSDTTQYHEHFDQFSSDPWRPLLWTAIFVLINFFILIRGARGIEKASNILMPALFVILVVFCINSLMLPEAANGLYFLFHPDFSQIDGSTLLAALGQSFFSLSLGIGTMTTYASYFSDSTRLGRSAMQIALLDTMVAVLAGIIIFPAVFSFGGSVEAGPRLVFEVLPNIFHHLPFGALWSTLFFFLLILASLTSTLSMHEIVIAFLTEEKGMSRKKATFWVCAVVLVLASVSSLSFGVLDDFTIFGLTFFNLLDYTASNIIMPIGGLIISVFIGWVVDRKFVKGQMTNHGRIRCYILKAVVFSLRYIAPTAIVLIFLDSTGLLRHLW